MGNAFGKIIWNEYSFVIQRSKHGLKRILMCVAPAENFTSDLFFKNSSSLAFATQTLGGSLLFGEQSVRVDLCTKSSTNLVASNALSLRDAIEVPIRYKIG